MCNHSALLHGENSDLIYYNIHMLACQIVLVIITSYPLPNVQCAGVNADNYQGVFSEPVNVTVPEKQKLQGIMQYIIV